jgi:hypothetical protein
MVEKHLAAILAAFNADRSPKGCSLEDLEQDCALLFASMRQELLRMQALCLSPARGSQSHPQANRHFVLRRLWLEQLPLLHRPLLLRAALLLAAAGRTEGARAVFVNLLSCSPGDESVLECLDAGSRLPEAERNALRERYALRAVGRFGAPAGCFLSGLAFDEQAGTLLATDRLSGALHLFDFEGLWLRKVVLPSSGLGGVAPAGGLWWVCDWTGSRVFALAPTGEVLRTVDCAALLPAGFPSRPEQIAVCGDTLFLQCTRRENDAATGSVQESGLARIDLARIDLAAGGQRVQLGERARYGIGGLALQGDRLLALSLMSPASITEYSPHDLALSRTLRLDEGGYYLSLGFVGGELFVFSGEGLLKFDAAGGLVYCADMSRFCLGNMSTMAVAKHNGQRRIFTYQYGNHDIGVFAV